MEFVPRLCIFFARNKELNVHSRSDVKLGTNLVSTPSEARTYLP